MRNYAKIAFNRWKRYSKIWKAYINYEDSEHKRRFGNQHPNQIFYVIRPNSKRAGLMSIHNYVAWKIRYALDQGYIPIVDYKNHPNMYLEKKQIGKINAWELFFEQPTKWTLADIRKSRNVIIADRHLQAGYGGIEDENEIAYFHNLIKNYIRPTEKTASCLESALQDFFPENAKVLGVLGRGTEYTSTKPYGHAVVPSEQQLIDKTLALANAWGGFDYIYLATEDERVYKTFREAFGDKLLVYGKKFYEHDTKGKSLAEVDKRKKSEERYQKGLEYLTTIYLLAECDSIITSVVGGGLGAVRINGNKYTHKYVFHLGEYS